MKREEIENVTPEEEMLARMWVDCDPNRAGSEKGSGYHPDDIEALHIDGQPEGHPRWKWFLPRARASLEYFAARGYSLIKEAGE